MNNRKKLTILSVLFLGLVFTSCEPEDTTPPTIELTSPAEGQTYAVSDVVELVGRASDDEALSSLIITSDLGLNETISTFDDPADFPFNININLDESTPAGEYTITLTATDLSDNSTEESKVINVN